MFQRIKYKFSISRINTIQLFYNTFKTSSNINQPHNNLIEKTTQSKKIYNNDICSYCRGSGLVMCYDCKGCGKIYFDGIKEIICDSCKRLGNRCCDMCGGSGKTYCIF